MAEYIAIMVINNKTPGTSLERLILSVLTSFVDQINTELSDCELFLLQYIITNGVRK